MPQVGQQLEGSSVLQGLSKVAHACIWEQREPEGSFASLASINLSGGAGTGAEATARWCIQCGCKGHLAHEHDPQS